jgi:hypothetical protein
MKTWHEEITHLRAFLPPKPPVVIVPPPRPLAKAAPRRLPRHLAITAMKNGL